MGIFDCHVGFAGGYCLYVNISIFIFVYINNNYFLCVHISGQIIATSHDLTPNGGLVREIPLFQGNLRW